MKGKLTDSMNKNRAKRLAWIKAKQDAKWTQQRMADHLGITRQRVQKIIKDAAK